MFVVVSTDNRIKMNWSKFLPLTNYPCSSLFSLHAYHAQNLAYHPGSFKPSQKFDWGPKGKP